MLRTACATVSMGLLTAAAAATAAVPAAPSRPLPTATLATCSWERPGHDPYMGEMGAAVDRYSDIPAPVRARLKERMAARQYDDLVEIRRDRIQGRSDYGSAITDMHFGAGRICHTVSRAGWTDAMQERGLVYCEQGQCVVVPTVCRNVSRITKTEPVALDHPLLFDPPGAGLAAVPAGLDPAGGPVAFADLPIVPFEVPPPTEGAERNIAEATPFFGFPVGGGGGLGAPTHATTASTTGDPSLPITPGAPGDPGASVPPVTIAVPEPSTWGLLLIGIAAVVLAGARRQRPR